MKSFKNHNPGCKCCDQPGHGNDGCPCEDMPSALTACGVAAPAGTTLVLAVAGGS